MDLQQSAAGIFKGKRFKEIKESLNNIVRGRHPPIPKTKKFLVFFSTLSCPQPKNLRKCNHTGTQYWHIVWIFFGRGLLISYIASSPIPFSFVWIICWITAKTDKLLETSSCEILTTLFQIFSHCVRCNKWTFIREISMKYNEAVWHDINKNVFKQFSYPHHSWPLLICLVPHVLLVLHIKFADISTPQ